MRCKPACPAAREPFSETFDQPLDCSIPVRSASQFRVGPHTCTGDCAESAADEAILDVDVPRHHDTRADFDVVWQIPPVALEAPGDPFPIILRRNVDDSQPKGCNGGCIVGVHLLVCRKDVKGIHRTMLGVDDTLLERSFVVDGKWFVLLLCAQSVQQLSKRPVVLLPHDFRQGDHLERTPEVKEIILTHTERLGPAKGRQLVKVPNRQDRHASKGPLVAFDLLQLPVHRQRGPWKS